MIFEDLEDFPIATETIDLLDRLPRSNVRSRLIIPAAKKNKVTFCTPADQKTWKSRKRNTKLHPERIFFTQESNRSPVRMICNIRGIPRHCWARSGVWLRKIAIRDKENPSSSWESLTWTFLCLPMMTQISPNNKPWSKASFGRFMTYRSMFRTGCWLISTAWWRRKHRWLFRGRRKSWLMQESGTT